MPSMKLSSHTHPDLTGDAEPDFGAIAARRQRAETADFALRKLSDEKSSSGHVEAFLHSVEELPAEFF